MAAVSYERLPVACVVRCSTSRYRRFTEHRQQGIAVVEVFICCGCTSHEAFESGREWKYGRDHKFLVGALHNPELKAARTAWATAQIIQAMAERTAADATALIVYVAPRGPSASHAF